MQYESSWKARRGQGEGMDGKQGRGLLPILAACAALLLFARAVMAEPAPAGRVRIIVGRFVNRTPAPPLAGAEKIPVRQMEPARDKSVKVHEYRTRAISFEMVDADLSNLLLLFGELTGVKPDLADDVGGTVNVRMRNVPWDLALLLIADPLKLEVEMRDGKTLHIRRGKGYGPGHTPGLEGPIRIGDKEPSTLAEIMQKHEVSISGMLSDTAVAWIGPALRDTFLGSLLYVRGYDVVLDETFDPASVRALPEKMRKEPPRDHPLSRCDEVWGGSYRVEGDTVAIELEAVSCRDGRDLASRKWTVKTAQLPDESARIVLETVGERKGRVSKGERDRMLAPTTGSFDAWKLNAGWKELRNERCCPKKERAERLAKAERSLGEAVKLDAGYAEAWSNLGWVQMAMKDGEQATASFERALASKPDLIDALQGMAVLLTGTNGRKARSCRAKVYALNPSLHENAQQYIMMMGFGR